MWGRLLCLGALEVSLSAEREGVRRVPCFYYQLINCLFILPLAGVGVLGLPLHRWLAQSYEGPALTSCPPSDVGQLNSSEPASLTVLLSIRGFPSPKDLEELKPPRQMTTVRVREVSRIKLASSRPSEY